MGPGGIRIPEGEDERGENQVHGRKAAIKELRARMTDRIKVLKAFEPDREGFEGEWRQPGPGGSKSRRTAQAIRFRPLRTPLAGRAIGAGWKEPRTGRMAAWLPKPRASTPSRGSCACASRGLGLRAKPWNPERGISVRGAGSSIRPPIWPRMRRGEADAEKDTDKEKDKNADKGRDKNRHKAGNKKEGSRRIAWVSASPREIALKNFPDYPYVSAVGEAGGSPANTLPL